MGSKTSPISNGSYPSHVSPSHRTHEHPSPPLFFVHLSNSLGDLHLSRYLQCRLPPLRPVRPHPHPLPNPPFSNPLNQPSWVTARAYYTDSPILIAQVQRFNQHTKKIPPMTASALSIQLAYKGHALWSLNTTPSVNKVYFLLLLQLILTSMYIKQMVGIIYKIYIWATQYRLLNVM